MRLEVGPGYAKGGEGYAFRPYYPPAEDVVYADLRPPEFEIGCVWVVADAQHLPFRDGVFDEVYASHVIEHLPDPLAFLRECRRVLRPGGRVIIRTPNFASKNAIRDPDHKHVFNALSLRTLIRRAGLRPHLRTPCLGSRVPRPLVILLKPILLLICDELVAEGRKA